MAALCVVSEVAVSVKAERHSHVTLLHHSVQVWVHTLEPDCTPIDLNLETLLEAMNIY